MGVKIDQPRRDDLVFRVEHLASLGMRDVLGDVSDPPVHDGDVTQRGQSLSRVDHPTTCNQEIVGH